VVSHNAMRSLAILGFFVFLVAAALYNAKDKEIVLYQYPLVVTEVKVIPAGKISTLQFDPMYEYKVGTQIAYRTNKRMKVGDTIYINK